MGETPLVVETYPADEDIRFLKEQIDAYNLTATDVPFDGEIAIFVRDDSGAIVAGISGWAWGSCMEIESLWVHARLRGQGYGRRLLAAAEEEAIRRGCVQAVLNTHSFQAPGFYAKMGYEIYGTVENYPQDEQKIYLRKRLR